jgi:hypothetical protein
MAAQSITVYLPRELHERVEAAKAAGTLDVKEVVKGALQFALDGDSPPGPADTELTKLAEFLGDEKVAPLWQGQEGSPVEIAARLIERLAHPAVGAYVDADTNIPKVWNGTAWVPLRATDDEGMTYELVGSEGIQEFQSRLDAVTEAGGRPISVAISSQDKIYLLVGWRT